LPREYTTILTSFARLFSRRIWNHAHLLLIGAILTPGQRTVTAALRIMGLEAEKHFQNYHRVLNRARWSNLAVSHLLLAWLVQTFVPRGPVFMGLDDTIERRRGSRIKAKGIYRDPVRSSHSHLVKASGLRWLSLMLLAPIPWAKSVWALPFLTALCPSERYYEKRVRGHKKLTDWARQLLFQVRRWLPDRPLVVLADGSFAVIEWLWQLTQLANPICVITRLRLDAALYGPAPARKEGQKGRPRKKGERLSTLQQVLDDPKTVWQKRTVPDWYGEGPKEVEIVSDTAVWFHNGLPPLPIRWVLIRDPKGRFKAQALLCTDLTVQPEQIVRWFVLRWRVEVTFHEARTHLGVETQRQWSDLAIARTTPILLGLFSLVTLLAHTHAKRGQLPVRQAAWYQKPWPTFSDALAIVRQNFWQHLYFQPSHFQGDVRIIPAKALACLRNAVCYTT
jgi:hypothetical protein